MYRQQHLIPILDLVACRDVPFDEYGSNKMTLEAIRDLNAIGFEEEFGFKVHSFLCSTCAPSVYYGSGGLSWQSIVPVSTSLTLPNTAPHCNL